VKIHERSWRISLQFYGICPGSLYFVGYYFELRLYYLIPTM